LKAALAAAAALDALQQAAAVEGLAAVVVLRLAEVRQALLICNQQHLTALQQG
jgi:hypothetical protein